MPVTSNQAQQEGLEYGGIDRYGVGRIMYVSEEGGEEARGPYVHRE